MDGVVCYVYITWVIPITTNLKNNYFFYSISECMCCSKWEAFKLASLSGFAEPLGVVIVGIWYASHHITNLVY